MQNVFLLLKKIINLEFNIFNYNDNNDRVGKKGK